MTKKKTISALNKVKLGVNDIESGESRVKYICEFAHHNFIMPVLDDKGNKIYHFDANGNNKTIDVISRSFTSVSGHKNADGKVDPNTAFCFFVASKEVLGNDFDRVVAKLDKDCLNPINKMYREDDHFKKRNPEAFRIASEKAELESTISEKDEEINRLKEQLFRKKG